MNMRYLLPFALLLAAPACGEDDPPPPPKGAAGAKPGAKPAKPPPQIAPRVRVEDRVLDPDEKKGIRHQFKERDFAVDQNNRDPFQSFVLNQGLVGPANDTKPLDVTKKCVREDQMVASNYSYTDLRLVGIVAQGTQRKVLMMDAGNFGHVIKRGDCVGREKAVVKDIGTGYITFQVEPDENGSTGVARTGEERSVQLYPNQMPITSQPTLDNEAAKAQTPDVAPPTTAPRTPQPAPDRSQAPPPPTK
jgi:Tfp pilus assembly protein PilP